MWLSVLIRFPFYTLLQKNEQTEEAGSTIKLGHYWAKETETQHMEFLFNYGTMCLALGSRM